TCFAAVYRCGSEFALKILDNFRAIYRLVYPITTISFENFLQQAMERWKAALQDSNKATDKKGHTEPAAMAYFGSDSCRACHAEIYKGWAESGMAKMLRPHAPQDVEIGRASCRERV